MYSDGRLPPKNEEEERAELLTLALFIMVLIMKVIAHWSNSAVGSGCTRARQTGRTGQLALS
jgi:hypothetical protein